jgi:hypothetical protein
MCWVIVLPALIRSPAPHAAISITPAMQLLSPTISCSMRHPTDRSISVPVRQPRRPPLPLLAEARVAVATHSAMERKRGL